MKKGGFIVGTIIAVVLTVVFILVFANTLTNFFRGMPTVKGTIGDSEQVVCFTEHRTVHCLEKETGEEIFTFTAAKAWGSGESKASPLLTKDGLYFGIVNHFCAYDLSGNKKWDCVKYNSKIQTSAAETDTLVCFGDEKQYHCLSKISGTELVTSDKIIKDAITPIVDSNYIYFAFDGIKKRNIKFSEGHTEKVFETKIKLTEANKDEAKVEIDGSEKTIDEGEEREFGSLAIKVNECKNNDYCKLTIKHEKGFIEKRDAQNNIVDSAVVGKRISTELVVSENYICFGDNKKDKIHCLDKNNLSFDWPFAGKSGKFKSAPAIDKEDGTEVIYFGTGKTIDKYTMTGVSYGWSGKGFGDTAATDLVLGTKYVFGGIKNWIIGLDKNTGSSLFRFYIPETWDYRIPEARPVVVDGYLYFALEKVCKYNETLSGTLLTEDNAEWCIDFDNQIKGHITALPKTSEVTT
ncbi:PQQ-binding-like beta-propeller repeat protein [Candidatus Woesearchaeota archaeon]|nr:PQQ-binding-like beta-propeller repeat protein [Candidatus Woesearchaeota archaeon]